MPFPELHHAGTVFVVKRSLGAGLAEVKSELFELDDRMMVFGDAGKLLPSVTGELKESLA